MAEASIDPYKRLNFRFALGASLGTLISLIWILMGPSSGYPLSLACGGLPVIVLQLGVLNGTIWVRRLSGAQTLVVHSRWLTITAGFVSALLTFGMPVLVYRFSSSDLAAGVSTICFLVGSPAASCMLVLRKLD